MTIFNERGRTSKKYSDVIGPQRRLNGSQKQMGRRQRYLRGSYDGLKRSWKGLRHSDFIVIVFVRIELESLSCSNSFETWATGLLRLT